VPFSTAASLLAKGLEVFEVVLSIIGVAFATWALLGPASTEQIRAKMVIQRRVLGGIGATLLVLTIAYPFIFAAIPASPPAPRDLASAFGRLLTVTLVGIAAFVVWPNGRWIEQQLRHFHRRVESLILTGRAATVVDVLDRAFPALPLRHDTRDDEPEALPTPEDACFDGVLEDALVHVEFIRAAARHNRSFLGKALSLESRAALFASDEILTELMFGPDRLLPRELASTTNQTGEDGHFYWVPERCIILHALFDDIAVADKIACWKPIGDGVIRHIASQAGAVATDPDQRPFVEEYEKSRWTSPVGAGIWFFRVMATSAAKQGRRWHMWLPYLAHFIDEIDRVVEIPEQAAGAEFPNPYCYWIYDCVGCCDDVVRMASRVGEGNPNRPSGEDDDEHSVVAGALYTYGLCLASILKSERLPDRFKRERAEGVCLDFADWSSRKYPDGMGPYAIRHLQRSMSERDRTTFIQYVEQVVQQNLHKDAYKELLKLLR
jgi:hypothetical protein